ncbi:unnamed protein product [Diatraea saccharalis]|uniref:Uncharacterized protein n=1 Tax=Diatraea saccharalis TaxID=40085 RepID=A0A9N9WBI4_9NEOP|nr:unnamed protein product [Diatraea saccharalis]
MQKIDIYSLGTSFTMVYIIFTLCHLSCQCIAMQCYPKKAYLYFILQLPFIYVEVLSSITVLDKGVTPLEKHSVGIQFFVDAENKDRISNCRISTSAKNCCLNDSEEDCNIMQVYGADYSLKPKDRETFVFIYPTLYQHDQVGYCDFIIEYQCGKKRRSKKQIVNIPFDTKIAGSKKKSGFFSHYIDGEKVTSCDSLDQDSLNNCEAVNCDFKYGGNRQFYDFESGKCSQASLCESDPDEELPDIAYVPSTNTCRDLDHPMTVADIFAISTGTGVVTRPSNNDDLKVELKSNCSTVSQNLSFLHDLMRGNFCPMSKTDTSDFAKCWKHAIIFIISYILGVCGLVLSFICCVQSILWLHKQIRNEDVRDLYKKIRGKFQKSPYPNKSYDIVNSEVRNTLLRDVIVKDIPLELRESIVDICDRMDRKVKKKKRYRKADMGSQVSLVKVEYDVISSSNTSSNTSLDAKGEEVIK